MNEKDIYSKLVNLYAGRELDNDLEGALENEAQQNPELAQDMISLRETVDALHAIPCDEFTEESNQRILMKLYQQLADFEPKSPIPAYYQYQLPIQS